MSTKLTKVERETTILMNDLGEVTIGSVSPLRRREFRRRLGPPDEIRGETHYWFSTLDKINVSISKRRKATPKQKAQLAAMRAKKDTPK